MRGRIYGELEVIAVRRLQFNKNKYWPLTLLFILLFLWPVSLPAAAEQDNRERINCSCQEDEFPRLELHQPFIENSSVLEIQEALYFAGFFLDTPTGRYDEKTAQAVRLFQREKGLAEDGIVRYHVWLKLAKHLEEMAAAKAKIPAPEGQVSIVLDTFRRKILILSDNKLHAQFPIAIGKAETPSPIGNWKVINKAVNWGSGFGTRWMGLNVPWGVYGIHGTNKPWSIGSMASKGCFRMWNKDVETIYPWIKPGTQVTVIGNPFGYMYGGMKPARPGEMGSDVIYLQEKLKRLGFYKGPVDGLYGPGTEKAVKAMQKHFGLKVTGEMTLSDYAFLGIK